MHTIFSVNFVITRQTHQKMTLFRFSPNQTVINCKLSVRLKLNNERARNSEVLRIWNTNFKPSNFNLHCFLSRNPMRGQSPRGCRKRKITKLKFWRFPSLRHICSLHLAVEWPAGLVFPGKNSYKFMCRNLTLFPFFTKTGKRLYIVNSLCPLNIKQWTSQKFGSYYRKWDIQFKFIVIQISRQAFLIYTASF